MSRILLAGLFHETHTFVDETTKLKDFALLRGEELLACKGDGSPLGGFLEAAERFGWEVVPTVDMRAQPGGMVDDEVLMAWKEHFFLAGGERALKNGEVDAIYLVLHGAMVTPWHDDVEGYLLSRIRELPGGRKVPIFGVYDLHANFSTQIAKHANCLVGYRENPHTDACAMAVHAAELMHASLKAGVMPRTYWSHPGIMWPPTGTGTADTPMRDLEARARELEQAHPAFLVVNVNAGFSFADTPDTGVSFSIATTGEAKEAQKALRELCQMARSLREAGAARQRAVVEVLKELNIRKWVGRSGPVVLVEPSDNIGGGAPGDGTGLLRGLIGHEIPDAAVAIADAQAVRALQGVPPGDKVTLEIGGKGSRLDEGPLELEVTLVSRSEGRFELEDRQSHLASMCGASFDMGLCAVVRHGGVTILLTSVKTPPFDLGQWRSQGIIPEKMKVIGVKAAVAHRRAYDGIASEMLWVDTPGPCRSDLTKLPYKKVKRPLWPLDE